MITQQAITLSGRQTQGIDYTQRARQNLKRKHIVSLKRF